MEGCSVEEVHELLEGPQDPSLRIAVRLMLFYLFLIEGFLNFKNVICLDIVYA